MTDNTREVTSADLQSRSPAELSVYLRAQGWQLLHREGAVAFWTLPVGGADVEVLQPLDPDLRDYALRMGDAVTVLAAVEGRPTPEILRSIGAATWDVHTISLFPGEEEPGLISLEDGVWACESLEALLSAAAYPVFARQDRAVHPSRKLQGLAEFLRTVRMGPTLPGSYKLTVHTPVPPRLAEQLPLFEGDAAEEEPAERQVSLRLHAAVQAALEAADAALLTPDGLERFNAAVSRGVSANLCEALWGFGAGGRQSFEVSIALAAARPSSTPLPALRFRKDHLPVLREAAVELRARVPEENVAVMGEVVRLHRESPDAGEITLVGRLDDAEQLRRVWLTLAPEVYGDAVRAHSEMRRVSARGNLVRRGTRSYLTNVTDFTVLPGMGDE
ncbi:hypothetical protein [Mangrovihabitans endophyticus]|uniref:Uncharacterized protein n=1 Tax=Mangrovihabitans endophyticus TaxID=1751298 RepID=A0A8J3C6Y3_9ACTN|nr:hypothetical protein [Mangrovihabitans endophyticus]GGL15219.1 hypothetical protein GCM10012284_57330 [Mangrovihabitans endophyticus]